MFFFFKKPTVTIDAFVPERYAFAQEYAPIEKASKFVPRWFRELPLKNKKQFLDQDISSHLQSTTKNCPGVVGGITEGFVVPLWCDLRLDWDLNSFQYRFSDEFSYMHLHSNMEMDGFANDYWITKIHSPWLLKCSKPLKIVYFPLTYFLGIDSPIKNVHATLETRTSKNIFIANQFIFLKKTSTLQKFIYNVSTPLVHFLPMGDFNFKIKCYVDEKQSSAIYNYIGKKITFNNNYLKMKSLDKENNGS